MNTKIISKHGLCPLKYQEKHGVTLCQRRGWYIVLSQTRREGWWRCHHRFHILVMVCWWLRYNSVSYLWYGKWQSEPGRVGGSYYPQKFQGRITHDQRKWHLLWKNTLVTGSNGSRGVLPFVVDLKSTPPILCCLKGGYGG